MRVGPCFNTMKLQYAFSVLVILCTYTFSDVLSIKDEKNAKIKIVRNPNCIAPCFDNVTYIYQAKSKTDRGIVHWLLPGVTKSAPISILMLQTLTMEDIKVNWSRFINTSANQFKESILLDKTNNSYGLLFYGFCAYTDSDDTAQISTEDVINNCHNFLGKNLNWTLEVYEKHHAIQFIYSANSSSDSLDFIDKTGSIQINITIPKNNDGLVDTASTFNPGRGLMYTITITDVHLERNKRFAPILLIFSKVHLENNENFAQIYSISNNRYTANVDINFGKKELNTDEKVSKPTGSLPAYLQLSTMCSVSKSEKENSERQAKTSHQMHIFKHQPSKYQFSLPYAYYGNSFNQVLKNLETVGLRLVAVSLGSSKDGYYNKTQFVTWKGVLSMDKPNPETDEALRSLVSMAITIPVFLIILIAVAVSTLYYKRKLSLKTEENVGLLEVSNSQQRRNSFSFCPKKLWNIYMKNSPDLNTL